MGRGGAEAQRRPTLAPPSPADASSRPALAAGGTLKGPAVGLPCEPDARRRRARGSAVSLCIVAGNRRDPKSRDADRANHLAPAFYLSGPGKG